MSEHFGRWRLCDFPCVEVELHIKHKLGFQDLHPLSVFNVGEEVSHQQVLTDDGRHLLALGCHLVAWLL